MHALGGVKGSVPEMPSVLTDGRDGRGVCGRKCMWHGAMTVRIVLCVFAVGEKRQPSFSSRHTPHAPHIKHTTPHTRTPATFASPLPSPSPLSPLAAFCTPQSAIRPPSPPYSAASALFLSPPFLSLLTHFPTSPKRRLDDFIHTHRSP